MKKLIEGLKALEVKGKIRVKEYHALGIVLLNGEYFGIWDFEKNTFVD